MEGSFWSLKFTDLINMAILAVTVFAIYFGPIRAVEVSRRNDVEREATRRRREVFTTLMRTRGATMVPDHVWALNLIQVEFYGHQDVIRAYRAYIENLYEATPEPGPALDVLLRRRGILFIELLADIAKVVGFALDKQDLERAAYAPRGWFQDENEWRVFRRAMIELLEGNRPLPVAPFQPSRASPYPPPPK
jgi:hypothetical protein